MRNLIILAAAVVGGWLMVQWAVPFTAEAFRMSGLATTAVGGLLVAPAGLLGALGGAFLGALVLPRW